MYLKNLSLRGFKSFADKTELDFKSGITAVVGPNGSGKSNISDAVRWVLGEQSVKQLRGGKMEDVIFAGTQFRKPLGQASVSLTLDNTCGSLAVPYNEVTVTRRLYRSGESEYLINNQTVRLRDIHELFMDTGIGREGYSMIGQGKIDAILSGKNEERRGLVEEAAGITKFKVRKDEAEKKLRNSEENLLRVEDIISTYEDRIGPLKEDKEKALRFLELSGELKDLQVSLILTELEELEEANESQILEAKAKDESFQKLAEEKAQGEDELARLEEGLDEISHQRSANREAYYAVKGQLDELKSQAAVAKEREKGLLVQSEAASKAMAEALARQGSLEAERTGKAEELTLQTEKLDQAKTALADQDDLRESLEAAIDRAESDQADLKTALAKVIREEEQANLAHKAARDALNYEKAKGESLTNLADNYATALALNEAGLAELTEEDRVLEKSQEDLEKDFLAKQSRLAELKANLESLEKDLQQAAADYREGANRQRLLENLEENLEGYQRSVKNLFGYLKRKRPELLTDTKVLGDVIAVEPDHSLAIETALGASVGHVITKTDDMAKELIALLKREKLGRCTFLPQSVIKGRSLNLPSLKKGRILGVASDLVQTEPAYEAIIKNLLGRTLVAENMDQAVMVARETGYSHRIVTLEGDMIQGGGAMTGGSMKAQTGGVVSRRAEVAKLRQDLEALTQKGKKLKDQAAQMKEALEKALPLEAQAAQALDEVKLSRVRLSERMASFQRELDKLQQERASQGDAKSAHEARIEELTLKCEELAGRQAGYQEEKTALEEKLAANKEIRRQSFRQLDEARAKLADLRVAVTDQAALVRSLQETLDRLQGEAEELEAKLAGHGQEESQRQEELKKLGEEEADRQRDLARLEAELAAKDEIQLQLEQAETIARSRLKEADGAMESLRQEYYQAEKDLYKLKLNLEKFEEQKSEYLRRLNEDLELSLAEARDLRQEIESKSKAKKRIGQLKQEINGLGVVNPGAIEEYDQVAEHYEFLMGQRQDLERAKEELLELIEATTKKMRKLFRENFLVLQENFRDTFRSLFNGGAAELTLGDGDELTGTIDINVQPPGKKLQNINLLSGGEKVLSAIALTFAILRMKPSPFCFLDEIEAALDDANVYRYANFLKEFAKDTQFILITHRKGTMEAANILYGVTMEEKGISKIVSVDLDQMEGEAV